MMMRLLTAAVCAKQLDPPSDDPVSASRRYASRAKYCALAAIACSVISVVAQVIGWAL
jgi:hypothetical protein